MADKDPVREKRRDDQRHHRQSSQKRGAYLTDVAPADEEEKTEQQHRIEDHFHMGHHAFCNGEDIAEKVIEEGSVVHEMHAGADDDQQNNGDDGFFAGQSSSFIATKIIDSLCNPVAFCEIHGKTLTCNVDPNISAYETIDLPLPGCLDGAVASLLQEGFFRGAFG